jgi:hypothetical protein
MDAPLFACHKSAEGRDIACAGWLAVEGVNHVGVRIAVMQDQLDTDALIPDPQWPPLYESFTQMATANGATTTPGSPEAAIRTSSWSGAPR